MGGGRGGGEGEGERNGDGEGRVGGWREDTRTVSLSPDWESARGYTQTWRCGSCVIWINRNGLGSVVTITMQAATDSSVFPALRVPWFCVVASASVVAVSGQARQPQKVSR